MKGPDGRTEGKKTRPCAGTSPRDLWRRGRRRGPEVDTYEEDFGTWSCESRAEVHILIDDKTKTTKT